MGVEEGREKERKKAGRELKRAVRRGKVKRYKVIQDKAKEGKRGWREGGRNGGK